MNVFDYDDYRAYLKAYLAQEDDSPKLRKALLQATGMSTSFLTQVLAETKQLSPDHAYEVALHLGFTEKETDYFLLLVEWGRAGSFKLKDRIRLKLRRLQAEAQQVSAHVNVTTKAHLTEEQKAIYYSSWLYTAVRNLVPTSSGHSIKELAQKLNMPESKIESVVQFLLDIDFIRKTDDGLAYRKGYSHLDASHPLILRHHQNWRQRAIHRMDFYTEAHLHYTSPMAISKEAAIRLRTELVEEIRRLNQSLTETPEVSFCLNIDFFEY
jgi:uncharacterized protein (TIGR02147 family)